MLNRNKRVLWLLNHKTLMPYEARLLVELGYEVFTPKVIPNSPSFRSGSVSFEYDKTLTVPPKVLNRLNEFNFYEVEWPADIVTLINRYFGTIYVIPHGVQTKEAVRKFEGQIMFRAFGLDNSQTYVNVLEILYGTEILAEIAALGNRFWFAGGYDQLVECEPPLIADREVFLPIGVPSSFWKTANSYTGIDKRILFVCPNCVTNPYYAAIYKKFKEDFGDLPHAIFGAQDVPVDDPHLLGFVTDEELIRLYRDSAVLYYHSTELRHVHYSPIEATINGMPVIYFADSLLGRMTPEISMGRSASLAEARASIERILQGDAEYTNALREQQRALAFKFSDEYCRAVWKLNLQQSGYESALAPEGVSSVYWREIKRTILRPFANGLSALPKKTPPALPSNDQLATAITDDADTHTIVDGIDFRHSRYPSFVRSTTGLNAPEHWGRWSDSKNVTIAFTEPLPKKFRLVLTGGAYGPNVGMSIKVKIGNVKRLVKFLADPHNPEEITIDFSTWRRARIIEITVPKPIIPPNDNRQIGLGFVRLAIEPVAELSTR